MERGWVGLQFISALAYLCLGCEAIIMIHPRQEPIGTSACGSSPLGELIEMHD